MDGREGMALSGSSAYYLSRGIGSSGSGPGSGAGAPTGVVPVTPGFKTLTNASITIQPNIGATGSSSSNVNNSTYHVENRPSPDFGHGINIGIASRVGTDPVKKKRGRPRKYGPDGSNMSLALSPLSSNPSAVGSDVSGPKKIRGRPPGTGWKQQLSNVGDWMSSSAGLAFTPHVIHIGVGEDVAEKLLAFAQQRPRALCILSANGAVSAVTLRPPATSGGTVTYEGRFEILCLSGSYLVAEIGGPRNRTGGLSISISSPDGHVIGGAVGGRLIAASPVQVVVCSFVYGPKVKGSSESSIKVEKEPAEEKLSTPVGATPSQNPTSGSGTGVWPPNSQPDVGNSQTGIDLTRG